MGRLFSLPCLLLATLFIIRNQFILPYPETSEIGSELRIAGNVFESKCISNSHCDPSKEIPSFSGSEATFL